jgi:hypothetical protein
MQRYVSEDEKVSLDELQEKISEFEDYVQSTDVAAMQSQFLSFLVILTSILTESPFRAVNKICIFRDCFRRLHVLTCVLTLIFFSSVNFAA